MNITERIGVSKVQLIVYEKLHWIFREQPIDDCGIDAHIEINYDNYATGKMIAAQIKSGESYFRNKKDNEIVYTIDEKHLIYWKSNVLPVIIVLYNPTTEECIWEYVDKICEDRKIFINKFHFFDEQAKDELLRIANIEPYKKAMNHWRNYIENNKTQDILHKFTYINNKKREYKKSNYYIAIDFGTTRTMIGIVSENGQEASIVKTYEGKNYIDTVVGFDENYQYYIGADALKMKDNPSFILIKNFKRDLGLNRKYQVFKLEISPEDLTTLFLRTIIDYIELEHDIYIEKCIVSEPVDFSYFQKQAYKECIKNCNLYILRTISESTCVFINEELGNKESSYIIIDVGGGTFDITFGETGDGIFEVCNVVGERSLGGIDYDLALGEYIKKSLKSKYPGILIDSFLENQINFKAEEVKILLSTNENVTVSFHRCYCTKEDIIRSCYLDISRNDFRTVTESLNFKVKKILNECKAQIKEGSYFNPKELLVVGFGSNIFTINELIKECFSDMPINHYYTDKMVINGLITNLRMLRGYCIDVLLMNIFEFDLILEGEALFDVYYDEEKHANTLKLAEKIDRFKIIDRGVTIPTRRSTYFGVAYDQQISIWAVCEKSRDKILSYTLKNTSERTIYEILIDIDWNKYIYGVLKEKKEQKVIWEFII